MAQPQGYNQFSNYGPVPGQQAAGQRFQQDRQRPTSDLNQQPPTGDAQRQQSQYPRGTFQQSPMWQSQRPQAQPQTQAAPPAPGAAGQMPPDTQPQTRPAPPPMPQMSQPTSHMEMGDYNAPGAWTNGYNPHMVQDQPAAPSYPQGTFQPAPRQPQPMAPPTPAPAPMPARAPAAAQAQPALTSGVPTWMLGQYDRALAQGYAPSTSVDPMSGEGWKNGISPQAFQQQNPYYGQTGYQGDLAQVQAQMAGGAQSAGIPTGVLDPSTYTQNPSGQPLWQPTATPQQQVSQDLSNWEATRFGGAPVYPPGTF